mmetsp:Transcript_33266/g.43854  ORF Transcript_33266/g.43854 Transcript_33266/m.43854 type:complete len:550 (+) Transcript_33266:134-1783(+)
MAFFQTIRRIIFCEASAEKAQNLEEEHMPETSFATKPNEADEVQQETGGSNEDEVNLTPLNSDFKSFQQDAEGQQEVENDQDQATEPSSQLQEDDGIKKKQRGLRFWKKDKKKDKDACDEMAAGGQKEKVFYSGVRDKLGRPQGYGYKIYDDLDRYEGNFDEGEFHGFGVYTWKEEQKDEDGKVTGILIKGSLSCEWDHGAIKDNIGKYQWDDGTTYEGELRIKRNGELVQQTTGDNVGTLTTAGGTRYVGQWKNGMRSGNGREEWGPAESYEGEFANNMKNGFGIYKYHKITYKGHFVDDKKDTSKSGIPAILTNHVESYEGHFKDDERSGFGTCWYKDGRIYSGEWHQGHRAGNGTLTWPDGRFYEGTWTGDKWGDGKFGRSSSVTWDPDNNKLLLQYEEKDILKEDPEWEERPSKERKALVKHEGEPKRKPLEELTISEVWLLMHRIGYSHYAESFTSMKICGENLYHCSQVDIQDWGIKSESDRDDFMTKLKFLRVQGVNMDHVQKKTTHGNEAIKKTQDTLRQFEGEKPRVQSARRSLITSMTS